MVRMRSVDRLRLLTSSFSKEDWRSGASSASMVATSASSRSSSSPGPVTAAISSSVKGLGPPEPRAGLSPGSPGPSLPVVTLVHLRGEQVPQCIPVGPQEDGRERLLLTHLEQPPLHHLQDGQEGDDHRLTRALLLEQAV